MNRIKRIPIPLAVPVLLVVILLAYGIIWLNGERGKSGETGSVLITIPKGATASSIARLLEKEGLISNPTRFSWYIRFHKLEHSLKTGTYEIPKSASTREIVSIISSGREAMRTITIQEGLTSPQIASRFQRAGICDSSQFMAAVHDSSFCRELGLPTTSAEGFLFPETYTFPYHMDSKKVLRHMVEVFHEKTGDDWRKAVEEDTLSLYQCVILASIVQGEFQLPEEAPRIAALYRNRLKRGMKLQADPTIQYILPGEPRRLLLKDLKIKSPYNTYLHKGLPPGPINNPGLVALQAAVHPLNTDEIFMVARGDGGHTFSHTWNRHLRAKKNLDKIRRNLDKQ